MEAKAILETPMTDSYPTNALIEQYGGTRVVAVAMEKGGVGKSTVAILLAIRAAMGLIPEVKKRILVMDFDDQQNTSRALLKMEPIAGHKAFMAPVHPDFDPSFEGHREWGGRSNSVDLYYGNPVLPYPSSVSDRLDVLPSDGAMLKAFSDAAKRGSKTLLEQIHEEIGNWIKQPDVQSEYDLIICDCPPGANLITIPVLRACTHLIVPTVPEIFGMDGIGKMMADIEDQNRSREVPIEFIGVLPNQVQRYNEHTVGLEKMRNHPQFGKYVMPFEFHRLKGFLQTSLPLYEQPVARRKDSDKRAEKEIDIFLKWVRHKMYGAPWKSPKQRGSSKSNASENVGQGVA